MTALAMALKLARLGFCITFLLPSDSCFHTFLPFCAAFALQALQKAASLHEEIHNSHEGLCKTVARLVGGEDCVS